MKLYEITNEYESIFRKITEDGEITQEMSEVLDEIKDDFEKKAVSVASYIKNIQAEEQAISDAIKSMMERKSVLTKQIESLTDYLQFNLQRLSINEIKSSPYFKIRLKKCPPSVDVFNEHQIPSEYWREKVISSIDKISIKEALTEGIDVPGATIQHRIKLEIK